MVTTTLASDVDTLWTALRDRLAEPGYVAAYSTEAEFEAEVWRRVIDVARKLDLEIGKACLTSHVQHLERSGPAWKEFCRESAGPDVNVLGSNNRLDIVLKANGASIGIEVKCKSGHPGKLTQGLGQAVLGLTHRDRTILAIHCGTIGVDQRERLRTIASKVCDGTKTSVVVVPGLRHEVRSSCRTDIHRTACSPR